MILDLSCGLADLNQRQDSDHKTQIHDGLSSYRP
jgi:hypothetical protein